MKKWMVVTAVIAVIAAIAGSVYLFSPEEKEYKVGRWWEPEKNNEYTWTKLDTIVVGDGLFKLEYPDSFILEDGALQDSSVCVKYKGSEDLYQASETENVRERLSVLKKRGGAHNYREFFIEEGDEYGYHFMVYDSCHHNKQEIVFGKDEYMNMGVGGMYAFASPDKRYIYVVGDILANSTGWVSTFIVYQVDTETLKAKLVDGVAAVRQEKNGFTLCTMSRCLTPDTISADMDFAFRDVTYGFDGKIKRKSKEYSSKEIKTRYGASLCNVKGLGINRGDY